MRRLFCLYLFLLLAGCVTYDDRYEQDYFSANAGYTYYTSPLRLRGLNEREVYQLANYPDDFLTSSFWSGIGSLSRFAVHGTLLNLSQ